MATVSAATDKRFRRAHVKPGSKRRLPAKRMWLRLRVAGVAAVLGFGLWRMATLVADAQGLQVGHLVVRGRCCRWSMACAARTSCWFVSIHGGSGC